MQKTISILLIIVGIIHLLPLSGMVSSERLVGLYGIAIDEPNLEILMRHRAVLFGLLGSFLILSAFKPDLRLIAITAGFISVLSFVFLALSVGGFNNELNRIVMADVLATVLLLIATVLHFISRPKSNGSNN